MAMMDEKGRVMGKINIIDLLVILVVLAVAIVLGTKFLGGGIASGGEARTISYVVEVEDVNAEVYESLQTMTLPDQLFAGSSLVNGYVVSMSAEPNTEKSYEIENELETDSPVFVEQAESTYDMTFVIEATLTDVANKVGTQEIRVGKSHIVKTSNFELEKGIIVSMDAVS